MSDPKESIDKSTPVRTRSGVRKASALKQENRAYFRRLGIRISELRKAHGLTQAELAGALGVAQQTLFAYELGDRRTNVMMLERIANRFELSLDQVVGRVPVRPAPKNRRLSPRAMRHAERLQGLSNTAQRFVVRIIDSLEASGHVRKPHTTQSARVQSTTS